MTKMIVLSYSERETLKKAIKIIDEYADITDASEDLSESISSSRLTMNLILSRTFETAEKKTYLDLAKRVKDTYNEYEEYEEVSAEEILKEMTEDPFSVIKSLMDTIDCLRG